MNLFLLSQEVNSEYDTYDSMIVVAEDSGDAVTISPWQWMPDAKDGVFEDNNVWVKSTNDISCKYIGEAAKDMKRGIVLSSFYAG